MRESVLPRHYLLDKLKGFSKDTVEAIFEKILYQLNEVSTKLE